MKNKSYLGAFLLYFCLISLDVNAQLEVLESGSVRVSNQLIIGSANSSCKSLTLEHTSNTQNTWYGIASHLYTTYSMPTGPIVSIFGFADAVLSSYSYPISPVVGVYGRSYMTSANSSKFSAGLVGIANSNNGIGVYGGIASSYSYSLPSSSYGTYAGYFAGDVKVTGTLISPLLAMTSDYRLKDNIGSYSGPALDNINQLRPVEYKFKQDTIQYVYSDSDAEMKVKHFGLIAQEVQKIFPNIVYEGCDGYLSVNYIELIPILIQSIQELSAEVSELKAQILEMQQKK